MKTGQDVRKRVLFFVCVRKELLPTGTVTGSSLRMFWRVADPVDVKWVDKDSRLSVR